ncbi:hypothetical protein LB467_18090 [Salegentibacter sp. JZCK2]|uniref:hypothetical protein n=1 Tax=Salegentibacter tibetensis TaxID=2873600 RepID=UPI001CCB61C8|nr:hypothetical protein [Salegentibacter tibetensis]MBZ9731601.1 hypothetical protein [Salegentibacter tibetensis]
MAQEVRGNAAIMPNYVNIAWEKCFCPFPFCNSFLPLKKQSLNIKKVLQGTLGLKHCAAARGAGQEQGLVAFGQ